MNRLLHDMGYSLQLNRKTVEGRQHPDRDAQFRHVDRKAKTFQRRGDPVVSVDTKKKELVGNFRNGGREWRPSGEPEEVLVHDFKDAGLGKAIPYGVYDLAANNGWVSVGVDHDTQDGRNRDVAPAAAIGRHGFNDAPVVGLEGAGGMVRVGLGLFAIVYSRVFADVFSNRWRLVGGGGCRQAGRAISRAYENEALARLRHAEVLGVQQGAHPS